MQPSPATFDTVLQAWVLTSHDDVNAALREPRLDTGVSADHGAAHRAVRQAVGRAFSADRIAGWKEEFERTALNRARALPTDCPVDLVASFAAPWALSLAVEVTGASPGEATELAGLAREVFLAAASAMDAGTRPEALAAAAELARRLPPAEATINVQAFVALSQTLPHLLAGAWVQLSNDPAALLRLRSKGIHPRSVEELLRLAGPSRAVFRYALGDLCIGNASIRRGERVVLMLAAANHDPGCFPVPDSVDFDRGGRAHVAFGGGAHSCSGAPLVRAAARVATEALLRTTDAIELLGGAEWIDGFTIRAPASLPAVLHATPARITSTAGPIPP